MASVLGSAIPMTSSLQTSVCAQPDMLKIYGSADQDLLETMATIRAVMRNRIRVASLPGATIIHCAGSLTSPTYISRWNMSAFDGALWGVLVHCANRHSDTDATRLGIPPGARSTQLSCEGDTSSSSESLSLRSSPVTTQSDHESARALQLHSHAIDPRNSCQDSGTFQGNSAHSGFPNARGLVENVIQDNVRRSTPPPHLESHGHRYWLCEKLGEGAGGSVMAAIADDSELVAIKIVPKWKLALSKETFDMTEHELRSLIRIARQKGHYLAEILHSFTDEDNLYIVMRYCPETLHDLITRGMPPDSIKDCAVGLVMSLTELEDLRILNMDIKPANILINVEGKPVITDFGLSHIYRPDQGCKRDLVYGKCGTCGYQSPEMLLDEGVNMASMWWALGIMLYEMYTGRPLFANAQHDARTVKKNIISGNFQVKIKEDICDPVLADLISKLLRTNLEWRYTGYAVRGHHYFEGVVWKDIFDSAYEPAYKPAIPGWATFNRHFDLGTPKEFLDFLDFDEPEGRLADNWDDLTRDFREGKYDFVVASNVRSQRTVHARLKC